MWRGYAAARHALDVPDRLCRPINHRATGLGCPVPEASTAGRYVRAMYVASHLYFGLPGHHGVGATEVYSFGS